MDARFRVSSVGVDEESSVVIRYVKAHTAWSVLILLSHLAGAQVWSEDLSKFDWKKEACPEVDMIEGKDFNRILAEDFLRAEIEGVRRSDPGGTCVDPSTYHYFKVEPSVASENTPAPVVETAHNKKKRSKKERAEGGNVLRIRSLEDIRIVSITRFPNPENENLKLVKYAVSSPIVVKSKGRKKSRGKSKPTFGDFVFERIKGKSDLKNETGCAKLFRPPSHIIKKTCP